MLNVSKPLQMYILFQNSLSAFSAQRVLSSPLLSCFDFDLELIPTPKEYSHSCTLAIFIRGNTTLCAKEAEAFIESLREMLVQKDIRHDIIRL